MLRRIGVFVARETRLACGCVKLASWLMLKHGPKGFMGQLIKAAGEVEGGNAQAARRLVAVHHSTNHFYYLFQKGQLLSNLSTRARSLTTWSGQQPQLQQPKPQQQRSGAQVAFTITRATRHTLKELGFEDSRVAKLKPAQALALAQERVEPEQADEFLADLAKVQAKAEEEASEQALSPVEVDARSGLEGESSLKPEPETEEFNMSEVSRCDQCFRLIAIVGWGYCSASSSFCCQRHMHACQAPFSRSILSGVGNTHRCCFRN